MLPGRGRVEDASEEWANAQNGEHLGRYGLGADAHGLTGAYEVAFGAGVHTPLSNGGCRPGDVAIIRRRELVHTSPSAALSWSLTEPDERAGVAEG